MRSSPWASGSAGAKAGLKPGARWIVADGADSALMNRSVPLDKALDDAIVALYQNGERLRPSNGYPMRLFLPGWEGNMSIKWLRSIKVTYRTTASRANLPFRWASNRSSPVRRRASVSGRGASTR